ncbi:MAG: 50S ribosomal protein L1 [Caldisericaceae bacterium]|nr:50S ribosomal protein L1 [Caldisericaceae bacterium]
MKRGKRYKELIKLIEQEKAYTVDETIAILPKLKSAKFDESIEAVYVLNVDPKHADQNVRGVISLPNGTGKKVKVLVFAKGDDARAAENAGADIVGAEELIDKIAKENFLDFDVAIATKDMMRNIGKIAKILGPRKLMPNPKAGTVTDDVAKAVKDFKAGKIEYRVDKTGVIHTIIGKISFTAEQIKENLLTLNEAILKARPASVKGQYITKAFISLTMSPSLRIDAQDLLKLKK